MRETPEENISPPPSEISVLVIVPFFQRAEGILQGALSSVSKQTYAQSIRCVIVDDGSPVSAADEIAKMRQQGLLRDDIEFVVMPKQNGGAATARNHGLDGHAAHADFIALLDSDDHWREDHLERGVAALGDDADFYFSDHMPVAANKTGFQRVGYPPAGHEALERHGATFYRDTELFARIFENNPIQTSAVIYRAAKLGHMRFDPAYQQAGEDHIFFMTLARGARASVYSREIEDFCGRGVNIYESARKIGADGALQAILADMKFRQALPKVFPSLDQSLKAVNRAHVERLYVRLCDQLVHMMGAGQYSDVLRTLSAKPWVLSACVAKVGRKLGIGAR